MEPSKNQVKFSSYEYVRTEKLENGDIVHFYKKVASPVEKPVEKIKEAISELVLKQIQLFR